MDMDQLRRRWREVSDEEIIKTAFTDSADVSPAALAVVYEEFVRRGLQPPEVSESVPAPQTTSLARRFPFLAGALVYYSSCVAIHMFILIVSGGSVFDIGEYLVAAGITAAVLLPPGLIAVWYMIRLLGGFQPDPEGHTRCGRCSHILRGLSEPRCPECGNRL